MEQEIRLALDTLPIGPLRYFRKIGSTNKEAARWVEQGAADLAVVIADEQTAGRGRQGRRWITNPDSALAFSLILKDFEPFLLSASRLVTTVGHLTGLGALSVCQALRLDYNLTAKIKWPNDILLNERKAGGVLAEAHWQGSVLQAVILGIGLNVTKEAIPPGKFLAYPATCVEEAAGATINRLTLLRSILHQIIGWRDRLGTQTFLNAWQEQLAFKNKQVQVMTDLENNQQKVIQGIMIGLDEEGRMILQDDTGTTYHLTSGEIKSLRDRPYRSNNHAR